MELLRTVLSKARVNGEEYVLLIDEYDTPCTSSLKTPKLLAEVQQTLSRFYTMIKANSDSLRFTFLTGVSYCNLAYIFAGFDNVVHFSLNSEYGALVGFTQEELEFYFSRYLDNAVKELDEEYAQKKNPPQHYTRAQLLADLELHYYGYCFDRNCKYKLYNPWAICQFLQSPSQEFQDYWFNTGPFSPPALLEYLNDTLRTASPQNIAELATSSGIDNDSALEKVRKNINSLLDVTATCSSSAESLLPILEDLKNISPFALLYQTGYFTIKRKSSSTSLEIGLPNVEVTKHYGIVLVQSLLKRDARPIEENIEELLQCLSNHDIPQLQLVCSIIVNKLAEDFIKVYDAVSYREILRILLTC